MPNDESYIIDICDHVLGLTSLRQYRGFNFLTGDTGRRLPVDAFYPDLNLVIEYHERQHTSPVPFMDRRLTVRRMPRGEQRRLYDDRRREKLPANGITLVVLDYSMFKTDSAKRLRRDDRGDEAVIRDALKEHLTPLPR